MSDLDAGGRGSSDFKRCAFVVPGDWLTPTGGYQFDRRIILGLRDAGWVVDHVRVDGAFPWPSEAELDAVDRAMAALPDGLLTVVDGLAFGTMPDVAARHASRLRLVALVHHPLHLETGLSAPQASVLKRQETEALRHAVGVIVPSPASRRDVRALGVSDEAIALVEPGVDRPGAQEAPTELGAGDLAKTATSAVQGPPPVRLLCVATLVPRKGHAVLLDALARMQDLPWELACVGSDMRDAREAARLKRRAARAGLRDRVHWLGEVLPEHLERHYAAADVFVLPSYYEGYGMVITEALAHGLPVVTTTGGALRDTLPRGAGLQVPPGDVDALEAALRSVVLGSRVRSRLARKAREVGERLPSWADAASSFGHALARFAGQCGSLALGLDGGADGAGEQNVERKGEQKGEQKGESDPEHFSDTWLALREPHDRRAREEPGPMRVMRAVERRARTRQAARAGNEGAASGALRVVDMGCGTGSNLRFLAPRFGGRQEWLMVDRDEALLAVLEAALRKAGGQVTVTGPEELRWQGTAARAFDVRVRRLVADLDEGVSALPLGHADLLTCSALLDLVGSEWIDRLVAACAAASCPVLLTLSVDGRLAWSPGDPDDGEIRRRFVAHQQRDKGMGRMALGPRASARAAEAFKAAGFVVRSSRSDWVIDGGASGSMLAAMVDGLAGAALEQDGGALGLIEGWRGRRMELLSGTTLRVGHVDLGGWRA